MAIEHKLAEKILDEIKKYLESKHQGITEPDLNRVAEKWYDKCIQRYNDGWDQLADPYRDPRFEVLRDQINEELVKDAMKNLHLSKKTAELLSDAIIK